MAGYAVDPASAWPEPLDLATAPVPRYGTGSLADLLPAITAGQGLSHPGRPAWSWPPPTAPASS